MKLYFESISISGVEMLTQFKPFWTVILDITDIVDIVHGTLFVITLDVNVVR